MIIKSLELRNFQVIKEFSEDFDGNVYFVTGDNELGKSTVLKAIGALLTGNRDSVLRNGENKGFAKMIVGDDGEEYDVELRFTESNPRGTLSIKQKTTGMCSNNVSMLQKIFGYSDFDAVEFSRWSETAEGRRKQIQVVKSLLPKEVVAKIDKIDSDILLLKEKRKDNNAIVKNYKVLCETAEKQLQPGDAKKYADAKDVNALMAEVKEYAQIEEKAKTVKAQLELRIKQIDNIPNLISNADDELKKAEEVYKLAKLKHENDIKEINANLDDYTKRKHNAEEWLKTYEANKNDNISTENQLAEAEQHNKMHQLVVDYKTKCKQLQDAEKTTMLYEDKLSQYAKERENLVNSSKLPIQGLTFTEDGLELNGVQFIPGKVSDSQIMEVAAKLIIASNPTVKVFRIARGESLGAKRLQAIIDVAKANGFQGFIEEVKRNQDELSIEEYVES